MNKISLKENKQIKALLIVAIGLILFLLGFNYLKSGGSLGFDKKYYAVYDNIGGLVENAAVTLNGYKVGSVNTISFIDDGRLLVCFSIKNEVKLSKKSIAHLSDNGIIGNKAIQIIPNSDFEAYLVEGDTLNTSAASGIREIVSEHLDPFMDKINSAINTIDTSFTKVNNIVSPRAEQNLSGILEEFHNASKYFNKTAKLLNEIAITQKEAINNTLSNTEELIQNLKEVTESLKTSRVKETLNSLNDFSVKINSIVYKMNQGSGTISKLLNDSELYHKMTEASKEAKDLMEDMKLHPKRYFSIFRRKEIPYKETK